MCAACRESCDGKLPLCLKCLALLEALSSAATCPRCAAPLAIHDAPCPYCKGEGIKPFQRVVALGHFEEPVREMIHAIKYHKAWPVAEYLAGYLLEQKRAAELVSRADVLVPVPLHSVRRMSRGFNQAAVLAERLGKLGGKKMCDALIRIRDTETQTHFHSRAQRNRNMKDAFALHRPRQIEGKHVILVDDVMTSGATLTNAAKALKDGRPASISAMVLAVADPRGRGFERV